MDVSDHDWMETRKAWDETGKRFSELGRHLSDHYRRMEAERGGSTDSERDTLKESLREVVDEVDKAFTSLGKAIRDPEAKATAERAMRSFGDAIASTFSDISEEIRQQIGSRKKPPEQDSA
jgi:hypothetical protein